MHLNAKYMIRDKELSELANQCFKSISGLDNLKMPDGLLRPRLNNKTIFERMYFIHFIFN